MPTLRVTVSVSLDGEPVSGYPSTWSLQADVVQPFDFILENTVTKTLPDVLVNTVRALLLRADKQVSVQVNGQPMTALLQPGGLLLLLDVSQTGDAVGTPNRVTNNSGEPAEVQGIVLGAST